MAHDTRSGRGGATIPYNSLANLIKGAVRSYGALQRRVDRMPEGRYKTHYLTHGEVSHQLLESLKDSLDGICREEDMIAVAVTIADLCKNSTFAQKK
jgi:hypothetical protein